MRILGIDAETTGLNFETDEVTELGWIIKDFGDSKPLKMRAEILKVDSKLLSQEIVDLTGISEKHLAGGRHFLDIVRELNQDIINFGVQYIVAHNGENFDKPFLHAKLRQRSEDPADHVFMQLPWLDTKADIVFPPRIRSTSLTSLAADHGFLNFQPHAALFDVATMLKVLECYDIHKVVERNKEPWVTIRAMVDYNKKEDAKRRRYFWENLGDKKFEKCWVKRIKASELDRECKEAPFSVVILEGAK